MKQIKKILVAMILVFALFLVACENKECPECPSTECNPSEVCQGLIDPSTCPEGPTCPEPTCDECPTFNTDKECAAAGWVKECLEGIVAPASVEFYTEDIVVGGTAKFEVEIEPANAFAGLLWLTSDPAIATVAEDGTITGVKPGKVMITAKSVLNGSVSYSEEVEVVERGLQDYEIAEREKNAIVAALQGYVSGSFDLPTTWNASAKVVYTDPNGREITRFEMPDLGEATSQNYALSGSVTYRDSVSEFNVTLKLVKVAEGKNDYEKVQFATEVAEAFLYEYLEGKLVEGDITLPVSVYGVALNWTSNKAYVLANDGKFARPNNNDTVTYTITPKLGAASASKTFAITAKGYTKDEKIAYLLKDGALASVNEAVLTGTVPLPEYDDKFGIKLTYVSGSPKLISNDGVINPRTQDANDKQEVVFTVTAVYNDLNAASEAFTEVFTFKTYVAPGYDAGDITAEVITFANEHPQYAHIPYGATTQYSAYDPETETQVIIAANAYSTDDWKFEEVNAVKGAENFKIDKDTNEVQLITQYFRYHEATLKVTKTSGDKTATYLWTINIGIGAEPHITYLGGRSHSYQASANPNERGDSLQGFSKWDKYVGIVANNNERTSQQYWSEFSGYTAYVKVPTGSNKVIYTLDAEGNVTIYATDTADYTIQQMFFMEFAVLHMVLPKNSKGEEMQYVAIDSQGNKAKATSTEFSNGDYVRSGSTNYTRVYYPVLANKESVRSTYGGNFGSLYVNETDHDLDIPVCSVVVDAGGKFLDGEDIYGAAKASLSVYRFIAKNSLEGKALGLQADKFELVVLTDDYGSNTSVKREQSWALDGYRPAMMAAPVDATTQLAEGSIDVKYKFTFGIELSNKNDKFVNEDGTLKASNYSQYGVKSTQSKLWGTPYVVLKKNGIGFAWHSQTLYTFSSMGGGYIAGANMKLSIYFSRYYRHAENEELSDYVRNDIKSYFLVLSGISGEDYDKLTKKAEFDKIEVVFDDLGTEELTKIEGLRKRLAVFSDAVLAKADVNRAKLALDRIIAVAKSEVKSQAAYAEQTKKLFMQVKLAYVAAIGEEIPFTIIDHTNILTEKEEGGALHNYYYNYVEAARADGYSDWVKWINPASQFPWLVVNKEWAGNETVHIFYKGNLVGSYNPKQILEKLVVDNDQLVGNGTYFQNDFLILSIDELVGTTLAADYSYPQAETPYGQATGTLPAKTLDPNDIKVFITINGSNADRSENLKDIAKFYNNAEFQALLATAKRNYDSLTPGQKSLYDNGFNSTDDELDFTKGNTAYIENSINYVNEIAGLSDKVSEVNLSKVNSIYKAVITNGLKDYGVVSPDAIWKITQLKKAANILSAEIKKDKIEAQMTSFNGLAAYTMVELDTAEKFAEAKALGVLYTRDEDGKNYTAVTGAYDEESTYYTKADTLFKAAPAVYSATAHYFVKLGHGIYEEVAVTAEEFAANEALGEEKEVLYLAVSKEYWSKEQLYVSNSFKDEKGEDGYVTYGISTFFNDLWYQYYAGQEATFKSYVNETITLAAEIKALATVLPSQKDVKNYGLGDSESAYTSLMKYGKDRKASTTGKIDRLIYLYVALGDIDLLGGKLPLFTEDKVITIAHQNKVPGENGLVDEEAGTFKVSNLTTKYSDDYHRNYVAKTTDVDVLDRAATITNLEDRLAHIANILTGVTGYYSLTKDTKVENKTYYKAETVDATYGFKTYTAVTKAELDALEEGHNPYTEDYYELVLPVGNFAGEDEDDILEELFALPAAIDAYKAGQVDDEIGALPTVKGVEISDKATVNTAKAHLAALTEAQKALLSTAVKEKPQDLLDQIANLEKEAKCDPVDALIDALPAENKLTLEDEADLVAAEKAYNNLANYTGVQTYFNAHYADSKTKLDNLRTAMNGKILEAINKDEDYSAAVALYNAAIEADFGHVVNASTIDTCKLLIATRDELSVHSKEAFDAQAGFKALYVRLVAGVKAYEAYTTPAE